MKKLWVFLFALLALLCFSGQALGQAYPGTVLQNSSGNYSRAVPYPQVLVCVANDGNVPCVTRAITYSDSTLGTQCTQTGSSGLLIGNPTSGANCNNPGIGDTNGNFQLYLANGQYTLCTFSGTWLCQQFTMGGSGGSGIGCGSSHSVVYSSALSSFACDPFFTDDGAGHPTAKSLGLTDSTYTGFFYQTAGGFPPLSAAHSVFVGAPGTVNTTYGINWPSALPSNGDCVSWTTSGSVTQFTDTGSPCGSGGSAASTYRTCTLIYGADNGGGLANLDLGPQGRQCILPYNATIIQVEVSADTGMPNVLLAVNHQGIDTNILSSALSTAASGAVACSTTTGGLGFDGVTTCSSTLQNTSALQGDYIEAVSGSASTAHRMSIFITFTQPNFTSGGTATSIGLAGPTGFQISNSPVLTAGTLTFAMPSSWTTGDLLLGNGSNSVTRLGIGSNNTVLTSNGTTASWQAASGGGTSIPAIAAEMCNSTSSGGTTDSCPSVVNVPTNTLVIAMCANFTSSGGAGTFTMSDTLGLSWTQIATSSYPNYSSTNTIATASFWANSSSSSGADTFTCSNSISNGFGGIDVYTVAGANRTSPVDGTPATQGNNTAVNISTTTAQAGSLLFMDEEYSSTFLTVLPSTTTPYASSLWHPLQGTSTQIVSIRPAGNTGTYYLQGKSGCTCTVQMFAIKGQ